MAECIKVATTFCGTQFSEKEHKQYKYNISIFSLLNVNVLVGAINKEKMMVGPPKNMVFCKISLASLMYTVYYQQQTFLSISCNHCIHCTAARCPTPGHLGFM